MQDFPSRGWFLASVKKSRHLNPAARHVNLADAYPGRTEATLPLFPRAPYETDPCKKSRGCGNQQVTNSPLAPNSNLIGSLSLLAERPDNAQGKS